MKLWHFQMVTMHVRLLFLRQSWHLQSSGVVAHNMRQLLLQISVTGVGAYYVLQHQMTVGAMIAAGIIVGRALSPFENAIASWKGFVTARKSLSRLNESLKNS